jgi:hypothetical protein
MNMCVITTVAIVMQLGFWSVCLLPLCILLVIIFVKGFRILCDNMYVYVMITFAMIMLLWEVGTYGLIFITMCFFATLGFPINLTGNLLVYK